MTVDVVERYEQASPATRRVIDRLLQQDADDRNWAAQIGPAYRQADVAALLDKSRQAVAKDHRMLALTSRSGRVVYPALQFDGRRLLPGLGEAVAVLSDAFSPWTIASWLTTPQPALNGATPLERLRRGDSDAVTALARGAAGAAS